MTTHLERMGEWISRAPLKAVPNTCLFNARLQVLNFVAAVQAGRRTAPFERVAKTIRDPIAINSAAAIAIDFDDWLFMAHPGVSVVPTALVLASDWKKANHEVTDAVVVGNEIAGRLGAACFLGPLNGQMWAFAHHAAAAAIAARYLQLEPLAAAHALAIALSQPGHPLEPGFFDSDAKLLLAGPAALAGIRAARLAEAGARGPLDLLDDERGFFRAFSFHPMPGLLDGLGASWVTETVSFKKHPGCAYFQPAIEAVLEAAAGLRADQIASVRIRTNAFAHAVHALSHDRPESAVAVPFSLTNLAALALLDGRLGGASFAEPGFTGRAAAVRELASRIQIEHDWSLTEAGLKEMLGATDGTKFLGQFSGADLAHVRDEYRDHFGGMIPLSARLKLIPTFLRSRFAAEPFGIADVALGRFAWSFPTRVTVATRDGATREAQKAVPPGAAGDPARAEIVERKFAAEVGAGGEQFLQRLKGGGPIKAALDYLLEV